MASIDGEAFSAAGAEVMPTPARRESPGDGG